MTCTGAVEIAVHGWDVSAARSRAARSRADWSRADWSRADWSRADWGGAGGRAGAGGARPIPPALATRMLRLGPLIVAGREGLFALPVEVPAQASPGDRLVGYLGRRPG